MEINPVTFVNVEYLDMAFSSKLKESMDSTLQTKLTNIKSLDSTIMRVPYEELNFVKPRDASITTRIKSV